MTKNAFHWQGEPSVFTKRSELNVSDFNGVNNDRSLKMTLAEKKHITYAKGEFLAQPKTQVNVYGKAK